MYQSIFYDRRNEIIHLWDDGKEKIEIPTSLIKYAYRKSDTGKYTSLYGDKLEKVRHFDENDPTLFESDVLPEMRVLLDVYQDSDEPSINHRIAIFDIEVDSSGGFPHPDNADKEITAIALYDYVSKQYNSYILDPDSKIKNKSHDDVNILSFKTEKDLLSSFLNKWEEINPTIISGWNTTYYDIPYIFNRIRNVFDKKTSYRLSPIRIAYQNQFNKKVVIAGVSNLDYLDLYKKFLGVEKNSYALGAVAKDEELSVQKITYKGSLNDLYKTDLNRYIEYNLVDVKVVVELDKKYDFIYLARSVCHKGHIPYEWYQMSSRFIDGAILAYLHRHGKIGINKPIGGRDEYEEMEREGKEGFDGAYVKEPVPGLYDWVFSADITSLYPSTIMTLNISNETKSGKIEDWDYNRFKNGEYSHIKVGETLYSIDEFKKLIENNKYSISSTGVLYSQDVMGVIPSILDKWFKERVEYRELSKKYDKEGDKEKSSFYDRRQKREKIFLNSIYGATGLPVFRFYDRDNAEAVTISGQMIIRSSENFINKNYNIDNKNKDHIIYVDTDSLYLSAAEELTKENVFPDKHKEFTVNLALDIVKKLNEFYRTFIPETFNISPDKNRIKIVGDVIAKKALWTKKKRYAMLKVFDMEKMVDVKDKKGNEGKVEVKGIDTVRSSFPVAFQKSMSQILDMILRGNTKTEIDETILKFEESLDELPILDLSKKTSVKYVSQKGDKNYNPKTRRLFQFEKGTPAGVKSALAYNDLLKTWKIDTQVESISHGQKVKWIYLIPNEFGIESVSLKGDDMDPNQMLEFVNKYVDRKAMYSSELKSKLQDFYDVIKWEFPNRGTQLSNEFFGGEASNDW